MSIKTLLLLSGTALAVAGGASASGLKPGQYNIDSIQQICLVSGGTWYGTTFDFNGHWISNPGNNDKAAIYGNYQGNGSYYGYYNDTITVRGGTADWYDYNDDNSYAAFLPGVTFTFVKKACDPPAARTGNHKAATQ